MTPHPVRVAPLFSSEWAVLARWLRTTSGDDVLDAAVLGYWPEYEADGLLEQFGIPATRDTRRELARQIDAALCEVAA